MRIALATPLYPPDTPPTALYVKDLAARLARDHSVTVLAYAYIPEEVEGVRVVKAPKRAPAPVRLASFFIRLARAMRESDLVIAVNGASVEVPLLLASLYAARPYLLVMRDEDARMRAERSLFHRMLLTLVEKRAKKVLRAFPPLRPELLPLAPPPTAALEAYEEAWRAHICEIHPYG